MADQIAIPPNNAEMEEALLGSLLIDGGAVPAVARIVQPDHLFDSRNQCVLEAIFTLAARGEPVDTLTVETELSRMGRGQDAGGVYLLDLIGRVPTALNAEAYAREVASLAQRRRLLVGISAMARLAYDQSKPVSEVLATAQRILLDAGAGVGSSAMSWREATEQFLDQLEAFVYAEGDADYFPFALSVLDKVLGDAPLPGHVMLVAAKKKQGKSTLMRQHMYEQARRGIPCAAFSYEEHEAAQVKSMISNYAGVEISRVKLRRDYRAGRDVEETLAKIRHAAATLSDLPIHPYLASGWDVDRLAFQIKHLAAKGIRCVYVDYLQLIDVSGRYEARRLELAAISKRLVETAKQTGVFMMVGSQVNDDGRTREAEEPENDCDAKLRIQPVELKDAELEQSLRSSVWPVVLNVELNRHGPNGGANVMFDKAKARFKAEAVPVL